eukprot:3979165-Amphidinium_carterae.1
MSCTWSLSLFHLTLGTTENEAPYKTGETNEATMRRTRKRGRGSMRMRVRRSRARPMRSFMRKPVGAGPTSTPNKRTEDK